MNRSTFFEYYFACRSIADMSATAAPGVTPWPVKVGTFVASVEDTCKNLHAAVSNGSSCGSRGGGKSPMSRTYCPKRRMCSRV